MKYTKDKKVDVYFRVSDQEKMRLQEYAIKHNMSMSDVVRYALLLLYQEEIEIDE